MRISRAIVSEATADPARRVEAQQHGLYRRVAAQRVQEVGQIVGGDRLAGKACPAHDRPAGAYERDPCAALVVIADRRIPVEPHHLRVAAALPSRPVLDVGAVGEAVDQPGVEGGLGV